VSFLNWFNLVSFQDFPLQDVTATYENRDTSSFLTRKDVRTELRKPNAPSDTAPKKRRRSQRQHVKAQSRRKRVCRTIKAGAWKIIENVAKFFVLEANNNKRLLVSQGESHQILLLLRMCVYDVMMYDV